MAISLENKHRYITGETFARVVGGPHNGKGLSCNSYDWKNCPVRFLPKSLQVRDTPITGTFLFIVFAGAVYVYSGFSNNWIYISSAQHTFDILTNGRDYML